MTLEVVGLFVVGGMAMFITFVVMMLKKQPLTRCIAVELSIFAAFYLLSELYPLQFGHIQYRIFSSFIPFANFYSSANSTIIVDGVEVGKNYKDMYSFIRYFIADFAADAVFGASFYYIRRNWLRAAVYASITAAAITVVKIIMYYLMTTSRAFDTCEFLFIMAGAFTGAFCLSRIVGRRSGKEADTYEQHN